MEKRQFTIDERIDYYLGMLRKTKEAHERSEHLFKKEIAFIKASLDRLEKEKTGTKEK